MRRRDFLTVTAGGAFASAQGAPAPAPGQPAASKPNVLLLFTDQHRFDALGCAGDRVLRTPNLDALAARGVRFSHAFTPTPVCIAARMSLITGHRAGRTHWFGNQKLPGLAPPRPTLMQLLAEAGYRTHAVGKMHFHGLHYGLHRHERMEEGVAFRVDDDYLMYLKMNRVRTRYPQGLRDLLYLQPQTSGIPGEHAQSTWIADRSIAFLREHVRYRRNRPFFLWTSWLAPHPPYAPCEPYDSMYNPAEMPLPVYADRPLASLPAPAWSERARLDGAHLDAGRMRRIRALCYGQISHVDRGVGRILEELNRLGLTENTVVVFTSDHGDMLGDHGLSQKSVPYEHSVRIPLILRWPGRTKPGAVRDDLVGLTDLLPTLVREVGLQYPGREPMPPGESLLSAEGGGLASGRDAYFIDYGHGAARWISIRTRTHKYALWASAGREELYDLKADPQERRNLAGQQPALARELRERVLAWERENGFADSFQAGGFRVYPEPEPPAEAPRNVVINEGRWPENLPEDERNTVESYAEAFTRAIARETTLAPEKLSLKTYRLKGGAPLAGTPWEEAWKRAEP